MNIKRCRGREHTNWNRYAMILQQDFLAHGSAYETKKIATNKYLSLQFGHHRKSK